MPVRLAKRGEAVCCACIEDGYTPTHVILQRRIGRLLDGLAHCNEPAAVAQRIADTCDEDFFCSRHYVKMPGDPTLKELREEYL